MLNLLILPIMLNFIFPELNNYQEFEQEFEQEAASQERTREFIARIPHWSFSPDIISLGDFSAFSMTTFRHFTGDYSIIINEPLDVRTQLRIEFVPFMNKRYKAQLDSIYREAGSTFIRFTISLLNGNGAAPVGQVTSTVLSDVIYFKITIVN